jgi:hypothetical protein
VVPYVPDEGVALPGADAARFVVDALGASVLAGDGDLTLGRPAVRGFSGVGFEVEGPSELAGQAKLAMASGVDGDGVDYGPDDLVVKAVVMGRQVLDS